MFYKEKMRNIPPTGVKWLKAAHLLFACLWVGGALSVFFIQAVLRAQGAELYGMDLAAKLADDLVIIPGALGCLLTGLAYSLFTPWGFFRHRWVAVKWGITVFGVLFGTFFLGPWLNSLAPVSKELGFAALGDYGYMRARDLNMVWGGVQTATLIFAVFISVLKPWRSGQEG